MPLGVAFICGVSSVNFTRDQQAAIETIEENLQIIACAGSGKTHVVSARIVEILRIGRANGVGPANIVAFTFTEKAAGELKDRIYRLAEEAFGTVQGLAEMFIGTIHSYCLHLLQSPPLYRYLHYRVLTDVQQRLLIDRYSQRSGLTQVPLLNGGGYLQRWKDSRLYQDVLRILFEGRVNEEVVPPAVLEAKAAYEDLCRSLGYLDYSMILSEAVDAVKHHPEVRQRLASQVKYLIVDEYQDVNPLQEELIAELYKLGANVCVVGDDDQTIYQWRGSDINNIVGFAQRYRNVRRISLNDNFRSSKGIVETARLVIERNPGRLPKRMQSADMQRYERGDILALSFSNPDQEAAWIAGKIRELYGVEYRDRPRASPRGLSYSDFAILLRSVRLDAGPILQALAEAGIPYVVGGMNNLFDTPEIQAIRLAFTYLAGETPPGIPVPSAAAVEQALQRAQLGLTSAEIRHGIRFLDERKARIGGRMDATLYLQRVYLDFLEALGIREERVTEANKGTYRTGETVFFNLGKFSQVISDFEQIHFHSAPSTLYSAFARFLWNQAPDYYPEGWEEKSFFRPDAVQVMTVHQAKGMQWSVVFVPALRKNRFPSRRQGGRTVWHVLPESCVPDADRYKGTVEDERRLFYVAITRAERFLFCTWAPLPDNQQQRNVSPFFSEFTTSPYVLTRQPKIGAAVARREPRQRKEETVIAFTFSDLKYYFRCPYQFKLRFLYGFDAPINRALGYGKSLHDALVEIHSEAIKGRIMSEAEVPDLVRRHLHLPYANDEVRDYLERAAKEALTRYLRVHGRELTRLEHVEKIIELKFEDGVVVSGRIDLIRRTDTGEIAVVDFKSREDAQEDDISVRQLHIYAAGYERLVGSPPDLIELHNLDEGGSLREMVDAALVATTLAAIRSAGQNLKDGFLPKRPVKADTCNTCDFAGLCRV